MTASREQQQGHQAPAHATAHEPNGAEHSGPQTRFSSSGHLPPVATSGAGHGPSASERGFPSTVAGAMPKNVDLTSANASVTIPAHRKLASDWKYDAETTGATNIRVEITHRGLRVTMSPGIHLDVTWPGRDVEINGVSMQFGAAPHVDVSDGGGVGVVPVHGIVESQIRKMLDHATAGTKLRDPHYDPANDSDLQGTVHRVVQGFENMFAQGKGGAAKGGGLSAKDVMGGSLGASFSVREPIHMGTSKGGFELAAGASVHLEAYLAAQSMRGGDNVKIDAAELSSSGIDIVVDGKPIARVQQLTVHHGGKVTVERMTALGKLAKARQTEGGLTALAGLIALASHDLHSANSLMNEAQNPRIVQGVAEKVLEDKVEQGLRQLVLQHPNALPGVNLAKALGIH